MSIRTHTHTGTHQVHTTKSRHINVMLKYRAAIPIRMYIAVGVLRRFLTSTADESVASVSVGGRT